MTMTKATKLAVISNMIAEDATFEDGSNMRDFISNEIALINKRNARKSHAPSKTQKENAVIKERIIALLGENPDGLMAAEVAKELGLNSPQKASALLKQLKEEGTVNREKTGKAVIFSLA